MCAYLCCVLCAPPGQDICSIRKLHSRYVRYQFETLSTPGYSALLFNYNFAADNFLLLFDAVDDGLWVAGPLTSIKRGFCLGKVAQIEEKMEFGGARDAKEVPKWIPQPQGTRKPRESGMEDSKTKQNCLKTPMKQPKFQ